MRLGDEVKVTMHPTDGHTMLIVGTMLYSEDGACVLVADHECIGMPINLMWLERTGDGNPKLAMEYRARYLAQFPHTLVPTPTHEEER